ncbi:MAG: sulfotransferase domain-containing protein [Phycisphaerales bacterium]|nr:sulfotransferase domain-containing protein [Planctomycetota bacterium]MCH8508052.1 sulfotransferase domain-containing protein [Phycisphaerales bacterium]
MNTQLQLRRLSNRLTRSICTRWGESLGMFPVLEYPKCGGTWLCKMLADALRIPFAQYSCMPIAMPAVVHGHWTYHQRLRNVVFLNRDGRDVIVSYYFHCCRRYGNQTTSAGVRKMIHRLYGTNPDLDAHCENLPRFIEEMYRNPSGAPMNWRDYNLSWHEKPGVVYTRYEDLRADCVAELDRIVRALGRESAPWNTERAVDGHSMQRLTGRAPGQEDRDSFIRKGVVGDWVNSFNEESMQIFADLAGDALVSLGYESSSDWRTWGATTPPGSSHDGTKASA